MVRSRGGISASGKKWSSSTTPRKLDKDKHTTSKPFNSNLVEHHNSGYHSARKSMSVNIPESCHFGMVSRGGAKVSGKKRLTSNVSHEQYMESNSPNENISTEPHDSGNQSGNRSKKHRLTSNFNQEKDMGIRSPAREVNLVDHRLTRDHSGSRTGSVGTVRVTAEAQDNGLGKRRARAFYGKRSSKVTDQHLNIRENARTVGVREGLQPVGATEELQPATYQRKKTRGPTFGVAYPKPGQKKVKVNVLMNTLVPFQARAKIGPIIKQHYTKLITS